jgi:hypothetical protein
MILTICEELAFYLTTSCLCCFTGIYFFSKKMVARFEITCLFEKTLNNLFSPPSDYVWSLNKWNFRISEYHDDYKKLRFILEKKIYHALKKNKSPNYFHGDFIQKQLMFHIVHILFDSLDDNGEFKKTSSIPFELKELDNHIIHSMYNYTQDEKDSLLEISTSFWYKFKIQKDGTLLDLLSTDRSDQVLFEQKLIFLLIKVINEKIDFENVINIILSKVDEMVLIEKNKKEEFLNLNNA